MLRSSYTPIDVSAAATLQRRVAQAHYEPAKCVSRAFAYLDGALVERVVNFVKSPMTTVTLSNVSLVDGLYPLVDDRLVYHAMHHNAEVQLRRLLHPNNTPTATFRKLFDGGHQEKQVGLYFLLGGHEDNFWHFLYNFVLRLSLLAESDDRELRERVKLVIKNGVRSSFCPIFTALGFDTDRLVEASPKSSQSFDELIVSELPYFFHGGKVYATPEAAQFVQERLPRSGRRDRRIYISRRDARWRKILNEEEVVTQLETFGFEVMELSRISLEQMISLMAESAVVIGPSGANLAATLFCRPGTQVIELSYAPLVNKYYFQGSSTIGNLTHYKFKGEPEPTENSYHTWNFSVETNALSDMLNLIL